MPTSIRTDGQSASSTVSFSRSNAHMPRETRRTVEPAKAFACQSVEKRCTRWNASPTTSWITWRVRRTMSAKDAWRKTRLVSASAISAAKAPSASPRAQGSAQPRATASTRRPE